MGRPARRGFFAAVLLLLVLAPAAQAQQYEDETGALDLEVTVAVTVSLSGEGYVADSVVYVTLTVGDEEFDLGTIPTDEQGRFFGEIALPEGLETGEYVLAATGVTGQGATRVLSALVGVGRELTLAPPPTTTTSTTAPPSTAITISRADRGDGLGPLETTDPGPTSDESPFDRVLLVRILTAGLVALSAGWWWLYRAAKA